MLFMAVFSCQGPINQSFQDSDYTILIENLRQTYAPDKRVAVFDLEITADLQADCPLIKGQSNQPIALRLLKENMEAQGLCYRDSVRQLPLAKFGADTLGLVNVPVANLRSQPKHSAELATQALLGMPLTIYDQQGDWFLVQTPDRYLAWLESGAFAQTNTEGLKNYFSGRLGIITHQSAQLLDQATGASTIRLLSRGNLVRILGQDKSNFQVQLPDGEIGNVVASAITDYQLWTAQNELDLPKQALTFYGAPYLWGGTSTNGMDCSGFTKMSYWLHGLVIPRDASQQVHAGEEIALDEDFSQLAKGDLLFFGNLREDGSQRITHVGIYLDNGRFVHAGADNGYIKEQSLFAGTPDYAAHRRNSLLRAKRLQTGSTGVMRFADLIAPYR